MRTRLDGKTIDTASRVIHASPKRIYRALLDPEALAVWLPPKGMRGKFFSFDARVGGGYRMALIYDAPDRTEPGKTSEDADIVQVHFLALVEDETIAQAVDFESDDPAFAGTMRMTWTLRADGEGTLVSIVCANVPVGITADDHDEGLRSSLANLAAFIE